MEEAPSIAKQSFIKLLKLHREVLVSCIKNTECVLNNLVKEEFFTNEDAELSQQHPTQTAKVRKILDLIENKGEETAEYFLHILHQASEVYTALSPWLKEIGYQPSEHVQSKSVTITDAVFQYIRKMKLDLQQDTTYVTSYAQKQDTLFEDTYTETLMELINNVNEPKGMLSCLDELFSALGVISEESETVIVTGDAGVGKSILLQKLQSLWSKGELCADVKFFFKFRCRIFNSFKEEDKISLKDLLFKYNCYPDRDVDEIFRYICQHAESVLFTLDGFDEINIDCDVNDIPDISSPFVPTHPVALLMNLLRGKLLKGSKKVLTARTGTILPLRIVRKKVVLKGFSKDNLLQYLKKFFKNKNYQSSVLTQLEANPHLCTLCSVPLFCWIIFKCYEHILNMPDTYQLSDYITLTDVYLLMLEVFLNRSSKVTLNRRNKSPTETFRMRRDSLMRFGKLAKEGIENRNFLFNQEQITEADISEQDLQLGFIKAAGHYDGLGNQTTYEFLHLTLQSFFTAFCLVIDDEISVKEMINFFAERDKYRIEEKGSVFALQCLGSNRNQKKDPFESTEHYQFTVLFLCGLVSKSNRDVFKHLAPAGIIQKKRLALKSYLAKEVRSHLKSLPRSQLEEYSRVQALPQFVWLMRYIFETQSEEVAKLAAKGICADYLKLTFCNACSADCSAVANILQHRKEQIALELDNNNINDYGVKELIPCFSKLTVVRLSVNQVTDDGAKVLADELTKYKIIKFLGLYRNQITDVGAQYIARVVEECSSLRTLKIGLNKLTSKGGILLAQAIQKNKAFRDIGMWGNKIGDPGAVAFAEALRHHPALYELSLAGNDISADGGKILAAALEQNNCLQIFWMTENQLNDEAAERMAVMLKVNRSLRHLWLINNKITALGAKYFSDVLKENTFIEEICLNGNNISAEEAKSFENDTRIVL
eukprot:gi/632945079/ref/XP_007887856.1/ PREDICTED: LOW QUALITY PROTEIN: nucleotide-binding oligomerization domain-containing protein 1 [Callorhinchus milii]